MTKPIEEGLMTLREAIDGTYDLADVAFMNEMLLLRAENEWRAHEAAKKENS